MSCPHGIWPAACATCKPIHSSKDQAWHFQHPTLGYIDSKGEFDRRCKAKGLVRVSTDELMTRGEPTKPGPVRVDQKVIGSLVREFKEKAKNPDIVAQHEQEHTARMKDVISPVGVDYARKEG